MNTSDLVDNHEGKLRQCELRLDRYGQTQAFSGVIATVKTFEDSVLLKQYLAEPGEGRVMVVDGAGSQRSALVGINLVTLAQSNGWAALIVNGGIRDSAAINQQSLPVYASHRSPMRGTKLGIGEKDVVVTFGNIDFVPGHHLYADDDGILVSEFSLSL